MAWSGPLRGLSLDQGVGNVLVRPQNPGIYRFRGRNTPSYKSVHTLKYELGSVLRRDWPGYSDLGVKVVVVGVGVKYTSAARGKLEGKWFRSGVSAGDSRQWEIEIDDSGVYN